jgi:hypothetical protein
MWPFHSHKQELRAIPPEDDPTSIGNLLLEERLLTRDQLQLYVNEFKENVGHFIGSFLVSKGVLTEPKLAVVLLKQKARRNGGVEHEHVMDVIKVAERTQLQVDTSIDRLMNVMARATGGKVMK